MVRPSSSLLLLLLLLAPGWAAGMGLGEIKLGSNLNQRLDAEIPLFALRPNDVEGMRIALASAELFRRAGVERAFHLTRLRFQAVDNGDGTGSIKITTPKVVNEPFLNFLLEVQWPNGRLVREFTLLLDPPVYGARLNAIVTQTVPTVRSAPPKKLPANPASAAPVQREPRRVGPRNVFAAPLVSQSTPTSPGTNQTATSTAGGTYGPVKRNDTLWSLAQQLRPDSGVSVHQMMLALLQANASAFINGNVNALRAGMVLRVPGREEAQANSQDDALAEVRRQNADWESIRRAVADNAARRAATTAQTEPSQTASAKTSQSSGEQTSAEQTSADAAVETKPATPPQQQDGKLQIVGADSGNAVGSGGNDQLSKLSEQLDLVREELTQSRGETEELTTKLTEAESIITDMERLAQIRDNQLAQLQAQLTQTQAALETAAAKLQEQAEQAAEQARLQAAAQQEQADAQQEQADAQTGAQTQADSSSETAGQQASNSSQQANTQTQGGQVAQSGEQATAQKPGDTATRPKVETSPQPPVAPAGPLDDVMALLDDLMGAINSANPSVLVGAGGAIVLLLGLTMFLRGRRRNRDADRSLEEVMLDNAAADADGQTQFGAAAAEGEDTDTAGIPGTEMLFDQATDTQTVSAIDEGDDATQMGGNLETSSPGPDEDPLQEANVYLAYERFDQARDVVNKAITNYPKRPEYRLKLLEIFHMMGDRASFDAATAELESIVDADSSLLTSARALAADFPDGSPAEAGDTGVYIDDDIASSTSGISNELDFDLGFGDDVVADAKEEPAGQTLTEDLDFDLGDIVGGTGTVDASDPSETTLDFELDTGDSGPESADPSTRMSVGTDVDFDLGGHQESATFAADPSSTSEVDFDLAFGTEDTGDGEEPEASTNTDIDFDLDFGGDDTADAGSASPEESTVGDLDFDLDLIDGGDTGDNAEFVASIADGENGALSLDFELDAGSETIGGDTDTERMQAVVPEAFETVELKVAEDEPAESNELLGSNEGSVEDVTSDTGLGDSGLVDLNLDGEDAESPLEFANMFDAIRLTADGEDEGRVDTVSMGPPVEVAHDDTFADALAVELPSIAEEETAELSLGIARMNEDAALGESTEDGLNVAFDLDEQATVSGSELGIDTDVSIDSAATADNDDVFAVLGAEPDTGSDELVLDLDDEGDDLDIGLDIEEDTNTPGADEETDTSELAFDLSAFADDDGLPLLDEVGSDKVEESSEVVADLLAVEETADMSDIELEPDISGDDIPEFSLDMDGVAAEDDGIPALDDATFEEETNVSPEGFSLDNGFDAAADGEEDEEEFTIDLELSDRSAPTIRMDAPTGEELAQVTTEESVDELSFDLVFDAEDIPDEALQTQLGEGELELSPDVEGGEPDMTPRGPQAGIGAETADGNASPAEPSGGGGGLDLDLGDLGWDEPGDAIETSAQRADTLVGDGIPGAGAADDAELDFDLTDFDPLADGSATIADNTGTLVAPTEDPELEPDISTLGTVDDEDEHETAVLGDALSREVDAVQTQLDLAQEYVQLGDSDAAREALEEVIADGNETQQKVAREMLDKLSS